MKLSLEVEPVLVPVAAPNETPHEILKERHFVEFQQLISQGVIGFFDLFYVDVLVLVHRIEPIFDVFFDLKRLSE